jgi:prepilin-type N-terminal cleavage/methylation domain-containing protein
MWWSNTLGKYNIRNPGFTLIELAIVLVIVGLLVGGVLVGRDLIHASELRAAISDVERIKAAFNTYKTKYRNAIPGDDPRAQNYFGAAACPDYPAQPGNNCSGTGDGYVAYININEDVYEPLRVMQHLALAGLLEGQYTADATGPFDKVYMRSKSLTGGFYRVHFMNFSVYPPTSFSQNGNAIALGTISDMTISGVSALLKPQDAMNIDLKIDDGKPTTGRVYGHDSPAAAAAPYCASGPPYIYNSTVEQTLCYMLFLLDS